MKTSLLSFLLLFSASALTAHAESKQVVTVNGQQQSQSVSKMTFRDDYVLLTFANGSTEAVDMESVTIVFTVTDAIKALERATDSAAPVLYFDLSGRQLKAPAKGSCIMKKGNKIVKLITK